MLNTWCNSNVRTGYIKSYDITLFFYYRNNFFNFLYTSFFKCPIWLPSWCHVFCRFLVFQEHSSSFLQKEEYLKQFQVLCFTKYWKQIHKERNAITTQKSNKIFIHIVKASNIKFWCCLFLSKNLLRRKNQFLH